MICMNHIVAINIQYGIKCPQTSSNKLFLWNSSLLHYGSNQNIFLVHLGVHFLSSEWRELPCVVAAFRSPVLDKQLMKGLRGAFFVRPTSPLTMSSALWISLLSLTLMVLAQGYCTVDLISGSNSFYFMISKYWCLHCTHILTLNFAFVSDYVYNDTMIMIPFVFGPGHWPNSQYCCLKAC